MSGRDRHLDGGGLFGWQPADRVEDGDRVAEDRRGRQQLGGFEVADVLELPVAELEDQQRLRAQDLAKPGSTTTTRPMLVLLVATADALLVPIRASGAPGNRRYWALGELHELR